MRSTPDDGPKVGEVRVSAVKSDRLFDEVKNEKKWSSHLDEETGKIYFFNELTRKRVEEKPADYDGEYVIGEQRRFDEMKYNRIDFTKQFCTPLELEPVATQAKPASTYGEAQIG